MGLNAVLCSSLMDSDTHFTEMIHTHFYVQCYPHLNATPHLDITFYTHLNATPHSIF